MHVFEADRDLFPLLAPDGLTVIIMPRPSLFNQYTSTAFIQDGTALANCYDYYYNSGVRIWELDRTIPWLQMDVP